MILLKIFILKLSHVIMVMDLEIKAATVDTPHDIHEN